MSSTLELVGALTPGDFKNEEFHDPRRREPRMPCDKTIHIHLENDPDADAFVPVQVVDCSTRGLGLVMSRTMEWGERFIAKLQLEKPLLLIYEARYSRENGTGQYRIGAEFVGFAAADDAMDLKEILGEVLRSQEAKEAANAATSAAPQSGASTPEE